MAKAYVANFTVVIAPSGQWTKWTQCRACSHLLRWTDYMSPALPGQVQLEKCPACGCSAQTEVEIPQKDIDEANTEPLDAPITNGKGTILRPI